MAQNKVNSRLMDESERGPAGSRRSKFAWGLSSTILPDSRRDRTADVALAAAQGRLETRYRGWTV